MAMSVACKTGVAESDACTSPTLSPAAKQPRLTPAEEADDETTKEKVNHEEVPQPVESDEDCDQIVVHHSRAKKQRPKKAKVRFMDTAGCQGCGDCGPPAPWSDEKFQEKIEELDKMEKEVEDLENWIEVKNRRYKDMNLLETAVSHPINGIGVDDWKLCSITIDSGASESVAKDADFPHIKTQPSEGSKRGLEYKAATGKPIKNEGEKLIGFMTDDYLSRQMLFQICDVTKPLASVSKICHKGHRVVFEDGCSYIMNLQSGEITWLREEMGCMSWTFGCPRPRVLPGR